MSDAQGSRLGTMFGPYYLKRLLGRGGMGEVYEAEHTVKKWTVALKLMSHSFSQDPVFRKRMEREARITGRLLEPHVVPIHDYGEIDGQLYLEMRLIEGIDMSSLLERDGPMSPPRAVAIITQVASALDAAHAAGVLHRDVKPPNILVTRDDFAYLVDFGIASARTDEKLTQLGTAVGTWKYMAPERFTNDEVTHLADIYALGCVLYECLTGVAPYRAESTGVLIAAHMMDPIPRPSAEGVGVPPAFDAVIARAIAKKPDDRYASAGALAAAAKEALSSPERDQANTLMRRIEMPTLPQGSTAQGSAALETPAQPAPSAANYTRPGSQRLTVPGPPAAAAEKGALPAADQPAAVDDVAQDAPSAVDKAPPQPGKRSRWPILAGAAGLVVVAVAAVGIWAMTQSSDDQPKAGTPSATKTAPPSSAGPSDAQARLLSLLPPGYLAGTCTPATPESGSIWADSVAMVSCGQNSQAGGPTRATYALFATPDRLKTAFSNDINNVSLVNCPGEGPSPVGWHYDETPKVTAGMIACGTYNDHPNVIWSNDDKLMLSDVTGDPATVADLHRWWDNYG